MKLDLTKWELRWLQETLRWRVNWLEAEHFHPDDSVALSDLKGTKRLAKKVANAAGQAPEGTAQ